MPDSKDTRFKPADPKVEEKPADKPAEAKEEASHAQHGPAKAQAAHSHPAIQPNGSLAGKLLPRAADQPGLRQDIEDAPVTDAERKKNSEAK